MATMMDISPLLESKEKPQISMLKVGKVKGVVFSRVNIYNQSSGNKLETVESIND